MRIRLFIVALFSLVLWTPAAAAASPDVEISVDRAGGVRVPVTLNGQGPLTFLLDTGSSHSLVCSEIAERFHLRAVAKLPC